MPESESQKTKPSRKDEDFLALALDRFKLAQEAESQNRRDSLDDLNFRAGNQWPQDIETRRSADSRPCLTMNRLPQFIYQVTNEQRQQRPSIQINPVGDGADVETAEVLQGIIRHIEVASDAEIAYDMAFEQMVTGGFGFFRLITDYVDDESFEQEIKIVPIRNPFRVYFDPTCVESCYADAGYAFIVQDMSRESYKAEYPDSALASLEDWSSTGDNPPGWATEDVIRVAEYFHVTYERKWLEKDGKKREVLKRKVKWAKINAVEILDKKDWLGQWIPIIPVLGTDLDIDGKRYLAGLVRDAKDPQRMYNYWASCATEAIALAPKAPFLAAAGQTEKYPEWGQLNTRTVSVLRYDPMSVGGTPVGPPQRSVAEPPIQAMALMLKQADNDMKATTGIYDASLGERGPDQSGKAVLARQKQSDIANLNYSDNLARSIRFEARQLIDLLPKIYDVPQIKRIVNPDGTTKLVGITNSGAQNGMDADQAAQLKEMDGVNKIFDIGTGRYDVTVSVGPSYQSKRQESVASIMALVGAYPPLMQVAGDLLVREMDWPQAREISDRLKKILPPALHDDDENGQPTPEQMKASMAQLQQQNQLLQQGFEQAKQMLQTKQIEQKGKLDIAMIQEITKIAVAEINASKDADKATADQELEKLGMAHDAAHEQAMAVLQHGHAMELGQQQAGNQQQLTAQQGQQQQDLAAQNQQSQQGEQ